MNAEHLVMPRFATRAALVAGLLLIHGPAFADGLHGRLELTNLGSFARSDSLDNALGERSYDDVMGDLRLEWAQRWNNWDFAFQYQMSAEFGGGIALNRKKTPYSPKAPPATLFDLTGTLVDHGQALVTHKIDRLAVGYSTSKFVGRIGRQALTWGAGKMFHPMDLIDPFAPDAVDTEYKPGVDMAYLQWLFADGSDLQGIAVPRPKTTGGPPAWDASTFALHYQRSFGDIGATWLAAYDHSDWTVGLGLSGPFRGAVWNAEFVPTLESGGSLKPSALANISYAMTLLDRNTTPFAEYFHNGFGVDENAVTYDALPADLSDRLARGQVFNVAQNYLAGGVTMEWTPLLTLSPSLIANLDDGSLYAAGEADWSLDDNTNFIFGTQVPIGPRGTEYGGLPVSAGATTYEGPAMIIYAQLRRHF